MRKKILFVLLSCLIFLFVFCTTSLGISVEFLDTSYELSDYICSFDYIAFSRIRTGQVEDRYLLLCSNSPIVVKKESSGSLTFSGSFYCATFWEDMNNVEYSFEALSTLTDTYSKYPGLVSLEKLGGIGVTNNDLGCYDFQYLNFDIKDTSGDILVHKKDSKFTNPYFRTTQEELESGNFDYLRIHAGDLTEGSYLYFSYWEGIQVSDDVYDYVGNGKTFRLKCEDGADYSDFADLSYVFNIPKEKLGISFEPRKKVLFSFSRWYG